MHQKYQLIKKKCGSHSPGASIIEKKNDVDSFVKNNDVIVIGVNFIPLN